MLERKDIQKIFKKKAVVPFRDRKLHVWSTGYWLVQPFLVGIPYRFYYSKFQVNRWENVPEGKPVIFAISHRNAFMDSLAFVNTKSTQVWQLARGDAWNNKIAGNLFYFFHMLPIWRERDGGDTKELNDPTFNACADILSKNGMVGIYPEGNCIDEEHIRPLKKGICRIAFLAEERYDFALDVHIIPVGINYSASQKFKKWQLVNVGKPILLKSYSESYKSNPALAMHDLKDAIENGMKEVTLHVDHSHYHHDIVGMSQMYARHHVLESGENYEPLSKLKAEKTIAAKLENYRQHDSEGMKELVHNFHTYKNELVLHNFRENTFDKAKHNTLSIVFMAIYFILFLPVFIYGFILNFIPYIIPQKYVEIKIKQSIFNSSAHYVIGLIVFPIYYLILTLIISQLLGSLFSALIFLISFPITGHIAFYYWYDLKKWRSVMRFRGMNTVDKEKLMKLRDGIINTLDGL